LILFRASTRVDNKRTIVFRSRLIFTVFTSVIHRVEQRFLTSAFSLALSHQYFFKRLGLFLHYILLRHDESVFRQKHKTTTTTTTKKQTNPGLSTFDGIWIILLSFVPSITTILRLTNILGILTKSFYTSQQTSLITLKERNIKHCIIIDIL
jgi:hypothetical protein